MKSTKNSAKAKLTAWLDAATTPYNAWETLTYTEIADQSGVSHSSVGRHLMLCVAQLRGIPVEEVKARRMEAWQHREGRMTDENLARLKGYRRQNPPLTLAECAVRLGMSLWSVEYHCKKHGLLEETQ